MQEAKVLTEIIHRDDQGHQVSQLHRSLKTLGLSVSQTETSQHKAGPDTQKKVRELQAKLNIPIDESVLVDEATANAIEKALKDKGLLAANRSFTLKGSAQLQDGAIKKRQQLLAFNLDFNGISTYRTVKTLAEMQKIGGYDFLGEDVSDSLGRYRITFYDWQYEKEGRKKADVVVFAVEDEKIIGRSRLINTEKYAGKNLMRDLDVMITKTDQRTEYKALMSDLNAFVKEHKTTITKIAQSKDQLVFAAEEMEVEPARLQMVVRAELLAKDKQLSPELLYGIGRQDIRLSWGVLYKQSDENLRQAIARSTEEKIIKKFTKKAVNAFLQDLRENAIAVLLGDPDGNQPNALKEMLSISLPDEKQRFAFMRALGNFKGRNFRDFWRKDLPAQAEFKDRPELIDKLLLTQQLTLLTGNHLPLIREFQVNRQLNSVEQLADLAPDEWIALVKKTGLPNFVTGENEAEKRTAYAAAMQAMYNAAFPTQRIAKLIEKVELPIEKTSVLKSISAFLTQNKDFDFSRSKVHQFKAQIKKIAGEEYEDVRAELMKIQRVFQVSTSPEAMKVLMEHKLLSAHTIAGIPRKNFIQTYGEALGGEGVAYAIHQRAAHISSRTELAAMHIMEYANGFTPRMALGAEDREAIQAIIEENLPNPTPRYEELFGSPDICECEHCRSAYSPAAYFVELLRFLSLSRLSGSRTSLLNKLNARRPDLVHLPLTCENTNTIIPYIDLVNEVLECYTAYGNLSRIEGNDTGDTSPEELRAHPQHFQIEAYLKLKDARYPFTLPYHQPLDVIHTYGDQLRVSRYEVMKAMHPEPDATTAAVIAAEFLQMSPEEYALITTSDTTEVHGYFGYENESGLDNMQNERGVRELLERTGLKYTELIALVKTRFLNPQQDIVDFIEEVFSASSLSPEALYQALSQIEDGTHHPSEIAEIRTALATYNTGRDTMITDGEFTERIRGFGQILTLFEVDSKCDLATTRLRTIQSIYEGAGTDTGISAEVWSRIHRFIRLWRRLGWSIHELDLMLYTLGETDITGETISKLSTVATLQQATDLPLDQLAVCWGDIDTWGEKALYKRLFLNKAVRQIDEAFKADAQGRYLTSGSATLAEHESTMLSAFRITHEDLQAILNVARVSSMGEHRPLDMDSDGLQLQNLSTLYRYVVLARALDLPVADLCKLIELFGASIVPVWDIDEAAYSDISPETTYAFYQWAASTKAAGFKPDVLAYIFQGELPGGATLGLESEKIRGTARSLREALAAVDRDHPEIPQLPLTGETLFAKLSLTFQPEIAGRLLAILEGTATFGPEEDARSFLQDHFDGVFTDVAAAYEKLVPETESLPDKLRYVYDHFLPKLRRKLKEEILTTQIAGLIGLSREATALLMADNMEELLGRWPASGFSATYYSDPEWSVPAPVDRPDPVVDPVIDFSWEEAAPDASFSVCWEAYIVPPASGEYTFVVRVKGPDEVIRFYIDGQERTGELEGTQWKYTLQLNGAQWYLLKLDYSNAVENAGIQLFWKTATSGLEIMPAAVTYPMGILNDFEAGIKTWHRAAQWITGFKINETELRHFMDHPDDFEGINFEALGKTHWERVRDYVSLRQAVPQSQSMLTDVFAWASSAEATLENLTDLLCQATAWNKNELTRLIGTDYFNLEAADFKNEKALLQLNQVMKLAGKAGVSLDLLFEWGGVEASFDTLHATAEKIKRVVKAKYEEQDWLEVAAGLNNKIRENQKQALISYLLTQPQLREEGIRDADGLFEYFLIDVQMDACMDTSRIVQANNSIQLFVNRCLLNLEDGISPAAVDKDRWEWMKNYRVWEANRKTYLYPENWLEPEWRNDKSEFFKELESYLVQNDITERTVEQAFRQYLMSLNEVANLEVCGMYEERNAAKLKFLHVFARTRNTPYKYFYRRWDEYGKWSAWEKIQLDIRSVEDGADSGVHLIPVVWKNRLFLFWPEFMEKQVEQSENDDQSIEELASDSNTVGQLRSTKYWEIRLAWSEYVDGKWCAKQLTNNFIKCEEQNFVEDRASAYSFYISHKNEPQLWIYMFLRNAKIGKFILTDINSAIEARSNVYEYSDNPGGTYHDRFMGHSIEASQLELSDNNYFNNSLDHHLIYSHQNHDLFVPYFGKYGLYPLFFSDAHRTYFAHPVEITKDEWERNPESCLLFIKTIEDLDETDTDTVAWVDTGMAIPTMPFRSDGNLDVASLEGLNLEGSEISPAFGMVGEMRPAWDLGDFVVGTGLEFHTFHHPYSSQYVTNLNLGGLTALMASDTVLPSDEGTTFDSVYDPEFDHGLVQPWPGEERFPKDTYYKENICFDPHGANSIYNWELFFHAPLYIATRLSKNGKYKEAMQWFHYIFDPTTDEVPGEGKSEISRYWKVLPFKTEPRETLEEWFRKLNKETDPTSSDYDPESRYFNYVSEWRNHPFDPHKVAANRPLAYMKHVVVKYVQNLIAWGDSLFRQDTMESVNEALQLYVIANHILGPYPEFVPKRGKIKAETYDRLKGKLDAFSNALVALENIFPYSSKADISPSSTGTSLLGLGSAFYFCLPNNYKLLDNWDTVADRLFKIRHCQNIEGIERKLALFAPPISPEALIQAQAQGLSLGSILAELSSPPPIYRFQVLLQKANEFCSDVKALGSAFLATLEKRDGEALSRLRASQESLMLEEMTAVKERQVLDAKSYQQSLLKTRETSKRRLQHYLDLLGIGLIDFPEPPTIETILTVDSPLPPDTTYPEVVADVDDSLVDSSERGVNLIPKEKEDIDRSWDSMVSQQVATSTEGLAGLMHLIPTFAIAIEPFGVGTDTSYGGSHLGSSLSALAKIPQIFASVYAHQASLAAKTAGFIRREQDWTFQANQAAKDIIQLDKQLTSAAIRIQIAEKELANHQQQIENAQEVEQFLKDKFTKQELYQWMQEQLLVVYDHSYKLAYDMAKKAEIAYRNELGIETSNFIQYGYWNSAKDGLVAGERLQQALRQLEKSYLDENRRELELSKSISLALLNPLALIELKETGKCYVSLPEELFDLDFQGHYFRRIKSVSLSIPCIAGPYTTVNCSLRLLKNTVRAKTTPGEEGYPHNQEDGIWKDDDRFRSIYAPVTSIATSKGVNDAGMFEFNFRDERYLPFEGAGVVSDWLIELGGANYEPGDGNEVLRQFDYSTIADVILHLNYTARESGGTFKKNALDYIKRFIDNTIERTEQPLIRLFNLKDEFPTQWHRFLNPATGEEGEHALRFAVGKKRFPFLVQNRDLVVMKIDLLARVDQEGDHQMTLSYAIGEETAGPSEVTLSTDYNYGKLKKATIDADNLHVPENIEMTLTDINPSGIEDIFLVMHYKLG